MLIGIDASRATAARPTGTERYSKRLIEALTALQRRRAPAARHHVRLYLRSAPPAGAFPGAELRVIPFPRLWTHVRLSWEMARHPPDALFVPAHVLPPIHPALSVVTIHDLGFLVFPRAHPRLQRLYLDLSTRWNARAASHLLADSEATKADLVTRYRAPPDRITVAHPGLDPRLAPVRDTDAIASAKARHGISGDYFLYLGTIQPRKNLARVIAAFASLDTQATLVLAGKRGWLTQDLYARVRRLGVQDRVVFPGYVPQADKAPLLSGALAFVFPSLYEGFGLPVVEAQACACPVITSSTSSLPEAAGEGALLVDPADVDSIAAAMDGIAADPTLRARLIERGLTNARRFSWTTCAQIVLSVIEGSVV